MIKKTAVLQERRIIRLRQHANLGIREDETAHQIVLQITFNRVPERFLDQTAPRFPGDFINKPARHFFFRNQRLQHRIPDLLGKLPRQRVKIF